MGSKLDKYFWVHFISTAVFFSLFNTFFIFKKRSPEIILIVIVVSIIVSWLGTKTFIAGIRKRLEKNATINIALTTNESVEIGMPASYRGWGGKLFFTNLRICFIDAKDNTLIDIPDNAVDKISVSGKSDIRVIDSSGKTYRFKVEDNKELLGYKPVTIV